MAIIMRFLTDDGLVGDGTNSTIISDGSSTAVPYYTGPPSGKIWEVHRIIVYIEDAGNATSSTYGVLSGLTNGFDLEHRVGVAGTVVQDLLDGTSVKNNGNWGRYAYDIFYQSAGGGNSTISIRWTFSKTGVPLILRGHRSEKLVFTNNDALAGLVDHTVMLHAVEVEGRN